MHKELNFYFVIPSYNESERLPKFAIELFRHFEKSPLKKNLSFQIVEDGSSQKEIELVENKISQLWLASDLFNEPIILDKNSGKGKAVIIGWQFLYEKFEKSNNPNLSNYWLGFVDADGSIPAYEIERIIKYIIEKHKICNNPKNLTKANFDALFASRIKMMGRKINRNFLRHYIGRLYATVVDELFKFGVYDSQCGLKIIKKVCWQKINNSIKIHGFSFDVDLLHCLNENKFIINEFPIDWHETPGSKVNVFTDSFKMLYEIYKLKKRIKSSKN